MTRIYSECFVVEKNDAQGHGSGVVLFRSTDRSECYRWGCEHCGTMMQDCHNGWRITETATLILAP